MQNLQIKTTQLIQDTFLELYEKSGCSTRSEFLQKLLDASENTHPAHGISEADQKKLDDYDILKEKHDNMLILMTDILSAIPDHAVIAANNNMPDAVAFLNKENIDLQASIENMKQSLESLRNEKRDAEGVLIVFTPLESHIINETCRILAAKQGKQVTPESLLKQVFFVYTYKGACDFFPRLFSTSQLKEFHNKFNQATDGK